MKGREGVKGHGTERRGMERKEKKGRSLGCWGEKRNEDRSKGGQKEGGKKLK